MSVAQLSARDFATFIAIATRQKFATFPDLLTTCANMATANASAWNDSYSDTMEPANVDDIEREALAMLTDKANPLVSHFGPIAYNTESQNGRAFYGSLEVTPATLLAWKWFQAIEDKAHKWQDGERARIQRQEENDLAYAEVGPCEVLTAEELQARAVGFERVIYARFSVDESDSMTDYFGGRQAREIIIGFATGKRENFKQLKRAAALFPPTAFLGPNCGRFSAVSIWSHDSTDLEAVAKSQYKNGHARYYKGIASHFAESPVFLHRHELDEWIAANPLNVGNDYDIREGDNEHRENYSMGGGNYLGSDRYSGWKISSTPVEWMKSAHEFYEPCKTDFERLAALEAIANKTPPKPAKPAFPQWTEKGLLQSDDGYGFARNFSKLETAQKILAKIEKLGHSATIVEGRNYYRIKLTPAPVVETQPEPENAGGFHELVRRKPVEHGLQTSAWFCAETFRRVHPKK